MAVTNGDNTEVQDDVKKGDETSNSKAETGEAEAKVSEPTSLEKQILRQVEYYFGDINLPRDKFMLEQIKVNNGWIPMSTMLKFQRLAKLTTDPKVIAAALSHSELMEVDESGEEIQVRRLPDHPLPEINDERRKELQERTIYCKGFPLDSLMDPLIEFFAPYGPVENIIMRKYKDQLTKTYKFKGSVFITFKTKEEAEKFLNIEGIKHGDNELIRKWQLDYIEDKKKETLENKLKRGKKPNAKEAVDLKDGISRGATIHLKGEFGTIAREDIKQKFNELGHDTAFISYNKGDSEAYVRLQLENSGKVVMEKTGKEITISDCKLEARLLEGEEEDKYIEKARKDRSEYMQKCQKARHGGRKSKGHKGGKGKFNRKRRGEAEDSSPPAKKVAQEAE